MTILCKKCLETEGKQYFTRKSGLSEFNCVFKNINKLTWIVINMNTGFFFLEIRKKRYLRFDENQFPKTKAYRWNENHINVEQHVLFEG